MLSFYLEMTVARITHSLPAHAFLLMRTHHSLFPTFRPFSRFRSLLSFPLRVSPSFIFSALQSCHALITFLQASIYSVSLT